MKTTSENRIEKILRKARQRVFEDDTQSEIIQRCKDLLKPTWRNRHDEYMTKKLENWLSIQ